MENGNDISSSLSFSGSSYLSNGSSSQDMPSSTGYEVGSSLELLSLSKLSSSLEKLVVGSEYEYSDAEIKVDGVWLGVNRCILAARSDFFHELFKNSKNRKEGKKPKYRMSTLVPHGKIGYEAFMVVLNYMYTGKVKSSPSDVSTCIDDSCAHDACGPAINYAVEMMYASATFQIKELVMVVQRRLLNFVDKAFVEDVIPIVMVAFHCELSQLLTHCIRRIAQSDLDNVTIEKELPIQLLDDIKSLRLKSKQDDEMHDSEQVDSLNEKRARRIHRALDSDDIELVKLLLDESNITLDGAFALHYAAAYCNPKTVNEVLNLGNVDLNLRNSRGHSVLHVAARRKDPSVVVGLLNNGACVSDPSSDGQTAVMICRRLTRPKDFNESTKHGQETNTDRLCVDVLEREMQRNPLAGEVSISSMMVADDLHMRLLILENRVAMARSLFPLEARLAMQIAHVDSTLEFAGLAASKGSYGNFKEVDLNAIPSEQVKRLHARLQALQKTVETGRRFFPSCSEVLDQLLEDDTLGALLLEKGSIEEQRTKQMRYIELKRDVMKAFDKDIAQNNWTALSTSSSNCSDSAKVGSTHKVRRK